MFNFNIIEDNIINIIYKKNQLIKYIIGGAGAAIIDVSVTMLASLFFKNLILCASIGYAAAFIFNYNFHLRVTFNVVGNKKVFYKYIFSALLNLLIMMIMIFIFENIFNLSLLYSKLIAIFISTLVGFILAKLFVFIYN